MWEPKAHIGVKIRNEPNSLTWSELTTRDPKAAEAFYTRMFGWTEETFARALRKGRRIAIGETARHVREAMERVVPLAVPLVVDVGIGRSWAEAH